MLNTNFSPWPSFSDEEIAAVSKVMQSNRVNYWTGEECRMFEREFGQWAGVEHAVSLSNGTLALDVALRALDVGPGDEVIVTPRSFIASVSCVVAAGATPVFADVDPDSGNLSAATIRPYVSSRTKALIVVHLAGWPADMDPIMELANANNIKVIEDCAQAHGAMYGDKMVGSIGHIGAWSFCQDKIMTTGGEGGMVTTNDPDLWSTMWSYKDHGKSWDAIYNRDHAPGFRWIHESFGTNWRMLEMQAAIGRIQLRKMPEWTNRRNEIAMKIASVFRKFPEIVRVPLPDSRSRHAFYRLYAYVKPEGIKSGWSRDRIIAEVTAEGVPVYQGTCPEIYREKAFDNTAWRPLERLPNAKHLGGTSLMFLTHPTLGDGEIERLCVTFENALSRAVS
jgi:dTDP-4-amino-4,6-dideoxygalactose transaminase